MKVTRKVIIETEEFKVGDQISVCLKDFGDFTLTAQKVTDQGTLFLFNSAVAMQRMNRLRTNNGGFEKSDLNKWIQTELLTAFPEELKSRIKSISIPTYGQIFGHDEFYKNFEPDNDEQFELMKDRKNRIIFASGDYWCWWWLKNATKRSVSGEDFACVSYGGRADYDSADDDPGVLPVILLG